MSYLYVLLLFAAGLLSCSKNHDQTTDRESTSVTADSEDDAEPYSDGSYCARVRYYYSETGTSSTYTLKIDVEDGELSRIHWPNGGWLDNSHFRTPDISDGYTHFTSYGGVDYSVNILGKEGDCSLSTYAVDEDELLAEKDQIEDQEEEEEQRRIARRLEEEAEEENRQRQLEVEEQQQQQQDDEDQDDENR